jgi:hypothetical protein
MDWRRSRWTEPRRISYAQFNADLKSQKPSMVASDYPTAGPMSVYDPKRTSMVTRDAGAIDPRRQAEGRGRVAVATRRWTIGLSRE